MQSLVLHFENTNWTIVQTVVNNRIRYFAQEYPYGSFVFEIHHENYKGKGKKDEIVIVDQYGFVNSTRDFL